MDMSMEKWISELEMDDTLIDQCANHSSEFDEYVHIVSTPEGNFHASFESQSYGLTSANKCASNSSITTTTTTKCGGSSTNDSMDCSLEQEDEMLTDGETNKYLNGGYKNNNEPKVGQNTTTTMTRTPLEAQDRVMAERKRREKLSQHFITLSAMVPGLKKMDKASVLEDAIKYLKQLQENMKALEEKINNKSEESLMFVKKSQTCSSDDSSTCDENFDGKFKEALPEIEARFSKHSVLIRIHCEKQNGFVVSLLSEIEKLHLTIVNTSFLPFGHYAVNITVVAQMEDEFSMTLKELVRNLGSSFIKCM